MVFAWFSTFVVVPLSSIGGVRVWQVEDPARLFFRKRCIGLRDDLLEVDGDGAVAGDGDDFK